MNALRKYIEDNGYLNATHILLMTIDPSTGEALDDAAVAEKKELAEKLAAELAEIKDVEKLQERFAELTQDLRQRRARLSSRIDRLRDAYLDGVETLADYKAARQQLQSQLDSLDAEIQKADAASIPDTASALRSAISATLETLRSPSATIAQKHESAQRIIEKCFFDKSRMLLTVFYQLSF